MQWNSPSEFLAMGGYALYVWGSLGVCALGVILETWQLSRRGRQARLLIHRLRQAQE